MKHNIVIDIETLGRRNDAAITQIGIVIADSNYNAVRQELIQIAPDAWGSCTRTFTGETILWWLGQKNSPLNEASSYYCNDYRQALLVLDKIFKVHSTDDTLVWTKGAMDLFCLKDLYEYFEMDIPWKFWQPRDIRTIKEAVKDWKTFENNNHNALEDALNELKELKANLVINT